MGLAVCDWSAVLGTAWMAIVGLQELGRGNQREPPGQAGCLCPLCVLPSNAAMAVISIKDVTVFFCSRQLRCSALQEHDLLGLKVWRKPGADSGLNYSGLTWLSARLPQALAVFWGLV